MRPRRSRPLFIIDIAVPRDVEPAAGDLDQVFLYNIDDLQTIVQGEPGAARPPSSSAPRRSSTRKSRGSRRGCSRARSSRRSWRCASGSRRSGSRSCMRLEPKLAALPPEARARVDEITRLIVEKLLLTPTEQLKARQRRNDGRRLRRRAEPAVQPRRREEQADEPPPDPDARARRSAGADDRGRCRTRHAAGSQLALVAGADRRGRLLEAGGTRVRDRRHQDDGDRLQDAPLSEVGGKRLFVKEIEDALLARRDRPRGAQREGHAGDAARRARVAAVLPREDPRDALVLPARTGSRAASCATALVASSARASVDRHGQRAAHRAARVRSPAARVRRHSRQSRHAAAKLDDGEYDALVLAAAGLRRLGFGRRASRRRCPFDVCVPAPGQGIVAIEIRGRRRRDARGPWRRIHDPARGAALTRRARARRGARRRLPDAARRASPPRDGDSSSMQAVVVSLDGGRVIARAASGCGDADPERARAAQVADGALAAVRSAARSSTRTVRRWSQ